MPSGRKKSRALLTLPSSLIAAQSLRGWPGTVQGAGWCSTSGASSPGRWPRGEAGARAPAPTPCSSGPPTPSSYRRAGRAPMGPGRLLPGEGVAVCLARPCGGPSPSPRPGVLLPHLVAWRAGDGALLSGRHRRHRQGNRPALSLLRRGRWPPYRRELDRRRPLVGEVDVDRVLLAGLRCRRAGLEHDLPGQLGGLGALLHVDAGRVLEPESPPGSALCAVVLPRRSCARRFGPGGAGGGAARDLAPRRWPFRSGPPGCGVQLQDPVVEAIAARTSGRQAASPGEEGRRPGRCAAIAASRPLLLGPPLRLPIATRSR